MKRYMIEVRGVRYGVEAAYGTLAAAYVGRALDLPEDERYRLREALPDEVLAECPGAGPRAGDCP